MDSSLQKPDAAFLGENAVKRLMEFICAKGWTNILMITPRFGDEAEAADFVEKAISDTGICLQRYAHAGLYPSVQDVDEALAVFRRNNCDSIFSIGDDPTHSCAKAVSLTCRSGHHSWQDLCKRARVTSELLPPVAAKIAAIGGGANAIVEIVDDKLQGRDYCNNADAMPIVAVIDLEMISNLPEERIVYWGMVALGKAMDALVSNQATPQTIERATSVVSTVIESLKIAIREGNQDAYIRLCDAQYEADLCIGNAGRGLLHAMARPMSEYYDIPLGQCYAVLLPAIINYNCSNAVARERYALLGKVILPAASIAKFGKKKALVMRDQVEMLSHSLGTHLPLSRLGVSKENIPMMAAKAVEHQCLHDAPIQPQLEDIERIYRLLLNRKYP
ncbi:iron-containing alcohol dehydrogenase [Eubacteriales bacterium OttesenSCG-928-N14]|nr:iron-containing alcohol dehydrogenase [Eubacteriales bacterium OttesenSCG-928-N14]